MNMLHDVFPYASRYEEEAVDNDAPNVNEAVDMSDYEKYNRLLEQAQTPVEAGQGLAIKVQYWHFHAFRLGIRMETEVFSLVGWDCSQRLSPV